MKYLKVKDWDKWQSYRKDRGTPPWIKIYRNLFSNPKWARLSDAEKGQLTSIWILAADNNGLISADPLVVRKVAQLDKEPNLQKFIEEDWLTTKWQPNDNHLSTTCQPLDAPETERETYSKETETKTEREAPTDFENLIFSEDFQNIAIESGLTIEHGAKSFKIWKIKRRNNPPKDLLGDFWVWCLNEIKPVDSKTSEKLTKEQLKIQKLGIANWERRTKRHLTRQQEKMLIDFENINGAVWWDNLIQYEKGKIL